MNETCIYIGLETSGQVAALRISELRDFHPTDDAWRLELMPRYPLAVPRSAINTPVIPFSILI